MEEILRFRAPGKWQCFLVDCADAMGFNMEDGGLTGEREDAFGGDRPPGP